MALYDSDSNLMCPLSIKSKLIPVHIQYLLSEKETTPIRYVEMTGNIYFLLSDEDTLLLTWQHTNVYYLS